MKKWHTDFLNNVVRNRKILACVCAVLALMVAAGTVYSLISPASTLETPEAQQQTEGEAPSPGALTDEQQAQVDEVEAMITALPSFDTIDAKMAELGDTDAGRSYYNETSASVKAAYEAYSALSDEQKALILDSNTLIALNEAFANEPQMLANDNTNAVTVFNCNTYNTEICDPNKGYGSILISNGKSVKDANNNDFHYWQAIVMSKTSDGTYLVENVFSATGDYETNPQSKKNLQAPANGLMLLVWGKWVRPDVQVGTEVSLDNKLIGNLSVTGADVNGYGTITFGDNIRKLPTVAESANTSELIEVNLYDYGDNINMKYNNNHSYPGFQQDYGSNIPGDRDKLKTWDFNFGNIITSDYLAGLNGIIGANGEAGKPNNLANINKQWTEDRNLKLNIRPIDGEIEKTLSAPVNGVRYPQLSDVNNNLSYLFPIKSNYKF